MATFKTCIFAHQKKNDGTYNVKLRVTHHRKTRHIATNLYAMPDDLTRGLKIKNVKLQLDCQTLERKCIEICNDWGYEVEAVDIDVLVEKLKKRLAGEDRFRLDFIKYMTQSIAKMPETTGSGYKTALNALMRYINGRETLDISEITKAFILDFVEFIRREPSQRGSNRKSNGSYVPQKKGSRAESFYIARIKAIYNKAKNEFSDEDWSVVYKGDPFHGVKIEMPLGTRKRAVSAKVIQQIIDLPPFKNSRAQMARDCFLLSFALMGMNSVDMLTCLPTKTDEIVYFRSKTKTRRADEAETHVRIEPCIEPLFLRYADKTRQRLFRFHLQYTNRSNLTHALRMGLQEVSAAVGEELTFYAARHSLATIARTPKKENGAGLDKYTVHELLNHVDDDMKVTDIYLVKNWRILFDANKKVLDLFDWSAVQ